MPLDAALKKKIIRAFDASRRRLPAVVDVAARPNVRRLASLSRRRHGGPVLNLSTAVVSAGEEAWRAVAPALEGDAESLRRLRSLSVEGIARNRRTRGAREARAPEGRARAGDRRLPPPRCQGTRAQRAYLEALVAYVRATSGAAHALPADVQLRISRTMTRSLGLCAYAGSSRRITIAERLFRPGLEDILWDTVKHELAHLADQVTSSHGRTDHGPRWKAWARRFGARPERLCPPDEVRRIAGHQARRAERELAFPPEVERWLATHHPITHDRESPGVRRRTYGS